MPFDSNSKKERITIGITGLITVMLGLSRDNENWMNPVLQLILMHKKHSKELTNIVKDFISKFWERH